MSLVCLRYGFFFSVGSIPHLSLDIVSHSSIYDREGERHIAPFCYASLIDLETSSRPCDFTLTDHFLWVIVCSESLLCVRGRALYHRAFVLDMEHAMTFVRNYDLRWIYKMRLTYEAFIYILAVFSLFLLRNSMQSITTHTA